MAEIEYGTDYFNIIVYTSINISTQTDQTTLIENKNAYQHCVAPV